MKKVGVFLFLLLSGSTIQAGLVGIVFGVTVFTGSVYTGKKACEEFQKAQDSIHLNSKNLENSQSIIKEMADAVANKAKEFEGSNPKIAPQIEKAGNAGGLLERKYSSTIGYGATAFILAVLGLKLIL